MGKGTRRLAVLGVFLVASGFQVGAAAAQPKIDIGTGSGPAGGTASVSVNLTSSGSQVAGAQNDIAFDGTNIFIGASTTGHCAFTTSQQCTTDSECPVLSPFTEHEPCEVSGGPACIVNAAGKGGFFAFLPKGCTPGPGGTCTGIRAVIFGINLVAMSDGPLYTCTVNIASGASGGPFALTNSNVIASDPSQHKIDGTTGAPGSISLGAAASYTVCDVFDNRGGDNAGSFGDGTVDILDVRAIFAAAQLGVDTPGDGSARFSAMDSFSLDSGSTCGGDQTLDILDVRQCFAVGQLGATNYVRTGTGGSCTSTVAPQ